MDFAKVCFLLGQCRQGLFPERISEDLAKIHFLHRLDPSKRIQSWRGVPRYLSSEGDLGEVHQETCHLYHFTQCRK